MRINTDAVSRKLLELLKGFAENRKKELFLIFFVIATTILFTVSDPLTVYIFGVRDKFTNGFIQSMRVYFCFIAPLFFLPGIAGKIYYSAVMAFFAFFSVSCIVLFRIFNLQIGGDCSFLLLNSNPSETREFLLSIASFGNIAIALFFTLLLVFCLYVFWKNKWSFSWLKCGVALLLVLPLSISCLRYGNSYKRHKMLSKCTLAKFFLENDLINKQSGALAEKIMGQPKFPAKIKALEHNIAGIVVIGESANRKHHSIYGYKRNTTPNLLRRKDSVLAFDNVLSAFPQTPIAIRFLLTDSTRRNPDSLNFTYIDALKAAGYKTYWVSNHQAWGLCGYELQTTLFAMKCDRNYFCHQKTHKKEFDAACLAPVRSFLKTQEPVILFVHIMGSHTIYSQRYPKNFGSFKNKTDEISSTVLPQNRESTNAYDCSIEYTDSLLEQMILELQKSKRPTFLLYVSDHGESAGLDNYTEPRTIKCNLPQCYEVPFLVWFSEEYKRKFPEILENGRKNLHAPLQGDHAIWSMIDLARVQFSKPVKKSSLFSGKYVLPERRIMYNQEYKSAALP